MNYYLSKHKEMKISDKQTKRSVWKLVRKQFFFDDKGKSLLEALAMNGV